MRTPFQLPKSTLVNQFIAKSKFYEKANLSSKLQNEFVNKIQKITWQYKLSEKTIGIDKTDTVEEIQIFELTLKEQIIPKNILKVMDKAIPYQILYVFTYEDHFAYGITLKDKTNFQNYYFSDWDEEIDFDFTGINLEKVYQKLIKAFISGDVKASDDFEVIVDSDNKIKALKVEIEALNKKIKKEKQFNKKVELNKILLTKLSELEQV